MHASEVTPAATDGERWMSAAERAAVEAQLDRVQITLRPIASPSGIGLFGLAAATFVLAGLQLGWVPNDQGTQVAFALIGFAFVAQIIASIFATLARDVVVGTAMAVLALTWLVVGLVLFTSPPGGTSKALGMLLVFSAVAMTLLGITALSTKVVPALVFITAALRFALTAVYEFTRDNAWKTATGLVGLVLFGLAVYTAWAMVVEGATKRSVLPLGRRGAGATAVRGSLQEQVKDASVEPGVRTQL